MSVRCGDCNNFETLDNESGLGKCKLNESLAVLDITPKGKRDGCDFEDKCNFNNKHKGIILC